MVTPEEIRLDGRVAVVTGAAVGLGEAIATGLARFGCDLAVCDRDADNLASTVDEVRRLGRRAEPAVLDVRDAEAVRGFAAHLGETFGRVDVLVNNAGGTFLRPFLELSERAEAAIVSENFGSVTTFVRACVPLMTGGGSIINLTSIEAHRAAPHAAVYGAMKAAVARLSQTLALELGERNIRVNCIAPDFVPTPGLGGFGATPPWTPLARAGTTDDIVGAAVWLAGPFSSFVTGQTLHVDGGKFASGGWSRGADGGFHS